MIVDPDEYVHVGYAKSTVGRGDHVQLAQLEMVAEEMIYKNEPLYANLKYKTVRCTPYKIELPDFPEQSEDIADYW